MNLTVGQTGSGAVMGGMLAALALTAGGGAAGYYFAPKGWGYKTVGVVAGALVGNLVGGMVAGASVLGALMGQRENEDKEQGQEPGDAGGLNFVTDQFLNYGTPMQFNPDQRYLYMGNMRGKKGQVDPVDLDIEGMGSNRILSGKIPTGHGRAGKYARRMSNWIGMDPVERKRLIYERCQKFIEKNGDLVAEQDAMVAETSGLNFVTDQFLNYGTPMQFNPGQRYLYMGNMRGKKYRKNYPVQAAYSDSAYIGKQGDLMDGYKPGAYRNAMARPKKRRYDGNSFQFVDRAKRAFMGM